MTSIREVAKLANVSPATVSRVMNGTANVNSEKRDRVLKVISETGFVPNEAARTLFKKSAKTIGLLIPSIENPFFTHLAHVIEKTAGENGYRMLLYSTDYDFEKEESMIQTLMAMSADGIIIATSNERTAPLIQSCNIPIVVMDKRSETMENCDYVHCDHYSGGRMAAKHLLECGCRHLTYICGPLEISSARERLQGYEEVCKEYGIEPRVINGDYDFERGLSATEDVLEKYPDTDGIIACNDMVAISAYKVLHGKGISVPEQVQIVGYDDILLAGLMTPEITTIKQPIEQMGRKAVELMIHEGTKKEEYIFPAELIVRGTTNKEGRSAE